MSTRVFRPMRSALYLPAINQRAIDKSRTLAADAVIFDLEDSVAPDQKAAARSNLVQAFAGADPKQRGLRVIRVNPIDSSYLDDDLETVAACKPDAVLLPKVSGAQDLDDFSQRAKRRGADTAPALWCMLETARGLTELAGIFRAGLDVLPRLDCVVVGTNDIARETGVSAGDGRRYLVPWLMNIVLAAKSHGVTVLDGVWNDFKDTGGYEEEVRQAQAMGFDGKTLIHPSQIGFANLAFAPSPEAVAEAHEVVAAFAAPDNAGRGVINLGGRMVERLHLDMARRVLEVHQATGRLGEHGSADRN